MRTGRLVAIAASLLVAAGCGDDQQGLFTDPQVTEIAQTGNISAIDAGQLGLVRTTSEQVRASAQIELTEHSELRDQLALLSTRLGIGSEPTPTSTQLANEQAGQLQALRDTPAQDFDRAWLDQQILLHKRLRSLYDEVLVDSAENEELRAFLQLSLAVIERHIEELDRVRGQLIKVP